MRDSVPIARYSSVCNVLRQWRILLIIESVDSISRDEPDSPLTQYITNAGISRARYTITHLNISIMFYQSNKCIKSIYYASLRTLRAK